MLSQSKAERTRALILSSAKEVLLVNGYLNTTIKMIAKKAGLGYGTIYSHFKGGKDEILAQLVEGVMEPFYNIAETTYTPRSKEEALLFTYKNTFNYLELALKNREMLQLIYDAKSVSKLINEKWEDITDKFIKRISKNVEVVRQLKLIRNPEYNSEVVAGFLYYTGERYLWKLIKNTTDLPIEEIAKDIATMYTNGLFK